MTNHTGRWYTSSRIVFSAFFFVAFALTGCGKSTQLPIAAGPVLHLERNAAICQPLGYVHPEWIRKFLEVLGTKIEP